MKVTQIHIQTTTFDIHQKLKTAGSELSYFMPVSGHNENATYVLFASLFDVPEYQIYERMNSALSLWISLTHMKKPAPMLRRS